MLTPSFNPITTKYTLYKFNLVARLAIKLEGN